MLWIQKMNKIGNITDKVFEEILLPFYNNYSEYLINFVIPDAIAFYLASGHYRNCLFGCSLINPINLAIDVFNVRCGIDKLVLEIEKNLKLKYNLKIDNKKPMRLQSVWII